MSVGDQTVNEMAADKTGAAGNQRSPASYRMPCEPGSIAISCIEHPLRLLQDAHDPQAAPSVHDGRLGPGNHIGEVLHHAGAELRGWKRAAKDIADAVVGNDDGSLVLRLGIGCRN